MSLTEIVSGSGVYVDDEGRFLVGGTAPLNTSSTAGDVSEPALVSIHGSLAAHVIGGEHRLSNDWSSQNVLRVTNSNPDGFSSIAFNAPGTGGKERGAIGVSPGHAAFGPRGTLYQECSDFNDAEKYGTYRGVQTKFDGYHHALREEWKENGDLVWYDRSIPARPVFTLKANGDAVIGSTMLATDATSGFLCLPTCRGKPTAKPQGSSYGRSPCVFDEINNALWIFNELEQEWRGADMPHPLAVVRSPAPFDPLSLALELRIDTRSAFYSDGSATLAEDDDLIQYAEDRARGNDAGQTTSGSRPTLKIVDGKRVVRVAADKIMELTASIDFADDEDFVVLFAADIGTSLTDYIFLGGNTADTNSQLRFQGGKAFFVGGGSIAWQCDGIPSGPPEGKVVIGFRCQSGVVSAIVNHAIYTGGTGAQAAMKFNHVFGRNGDGISCVCDCYAVTIKRGTLTDQQLSDLIDHDLALMA
jgi:hypothetical protein